MRARDFDETFGFRSIERSRFFADHMLSARQRRGRNLDMFRGRQSDADEVDVRAFDYRLPTVASGYDNNVESGVAKIRHLGLFSPPSTDDSNSCHLSRLHLAATLKSTHT